MLLKSKLTYFFSGLILITFVFSAVDLDAQTYSGKSNQLEVKVKSPDLPEKTVKPIVHWVYPTESMESINSEEVNLKLGISSISPVVKLTLIVNNELINVIENFTQTDPGYLFDAWLEQTVQLQEGANDIQLIVQNEQGALKHQRKITVEISSGQRRDHALILAVDDYDSWEELTGPVRDAERIARVLEEDGFNLEIVRNFTTFELLAKLEEYVVKEFQPHDQLFIYFAGHGSIDQATGEGYFVCKNSVNLQGANSTYISYEVIKSIVNNIPAQHIFMMIDAVRGKGEPLSSVLPDEKTVMDTLIVRGDTMENPDGKTRIGILSGADSYPQGISYSAGSELSKAFITYLRKSEQTQEPSWGDLLYEFRDISPDPIYVEFGDHSSGKSFTFKKPRSEN